MASILAGLELDVKQSHLLVSQCFGIAPHQDWRTIELVHLSFAIPSQIFRPEFLQDFGTNASNPFRLALQRNDLYNWRPIAAMRLFHCAGDTTVPYANSVVALNTFQANGATQVQLIDPYPAGNHTTGALPCYQAARAWFDLLKN